METIPLAMARQICQQAAQLLRENDDFMPPRECSANLLDALAARLGVLESQFGSEFNILDFKSQLQ